MTHRYYMSLTGALALCSAIGLSASPAQALVCYPIPGATSFPFVVAPVGWTVLQVRNYILSNPSWTVKLSLPPGADTPNCVVGLTGPAPSPAAYNCNGLFPPTFSNPKTTMCNNWPFKYVGTTQQSGCTTIKGQTLCP
jgi:hypothetical protein